MSEEEYRHLMVQELGSKYGLTDRQKQILEGLLKGGRNNDLTSEGVHTSISTVKRNVQVVYRKLGIASSRGLAALVVSYAARHLSQGQVQAKAAGVH